MPQIYEGSRVVEGSRSHSRLIVNELGPAPAGQWKIDDTAPGLFSYHYGGWTLPGTMVVIPKGSLVRVAEMQVDYRTNHKKAALNLAGPDTLAGTSDNAMAVAAYNYYRRFNSDGTIAHDFSEGDDFQPGIVTNAYIELPFIPNPQNVYKVDGVLADNTTLDSPKTQLNFWWGCATLTVGQYEDGETLAPGDYVRVGPFGKFVKAASKDDVGVVGRVYEVLTELPPYGWLNWVQEGEETDLLRKDAETLTAAQENGAPYPYSASYNFPADRYNLMPSALHKGLAMKDRKQVVSHETGTATDVKLDPVFGADEGTISVVSSGGTALAGTDFSYNTETKVLTIAGTVGTEIYTVTYQIPADTSGVIPSWDYLGGAGAVHIKLLF